MRPVVKLSKLIRFIRAVPEGEHVVRFGDDVGFGVSQLLRDIFKLLQGCAYSVTGA